MPFPISLSGCFEIDADPTKAQGARDLRDATASWLRDSQGQNVTETEDALIFKAGHFRPSWRVLTPVSRGIIEFEKRPSAIRVKYRLWFTDMLILTTVLVALMVGLPTLAAKNLSIVEAVTRVMGFWLWLFGGNFLLAWFRTRRALGRIAKSTLIGAA